MQSPLLHPHINLRYVTAALDVAGITIGSIGGALHARRHPHYNYDIVGVLGLALVSALGGGIVRDVLLNQGPPLALTRPTYLYLALAGATLTMLFGARFGTRAAAVMLYVDSAAISFFAVAGATRAESFGLSWFPALLLGLITAVGGGSIRDVLSGSTPRVFERGNFYAIAACFAALVYLVLDHFEVADARAVGIAVLAGFTLRTLSIRYNWTTDSVRLKRTSRTS